MTIPTEKLEEILRLAEKATPGPWDSAVPIDGSLRVLANELDAEKRAKNSILSNFYVDVAKLVAEVRDLQEKYQVEVELYEAALKDSQDVLWEEQEAKRMLGNARNLINDIVDIVKESSSNDGEIYMKLWGKLKAAGELDEESEP